MQERPNALGRPALGQDAAYFEKHTEVIELVSGMVANVIPTFRRLGLTAAPLIALPPQEKTLNYTAKVLTLTSKLCSWNPAKVISRTWHLLSTILPKALGCVSSGVSPYPLSFTWQPLPPGRLSSLTRSLFHIGCCSTSTTLMSSWRKGHVGGLPCPSLHRSTGLWATVEIN